MCFVVCLSRGVCVATLPSEVAADCSVGFVCFWLLLTLNSELLCSLTRGAAVCAGLGAVGPPRACSAPPRSRLWICTSHPG